VGATSTQLLVTDTLFERVLIFDTSTITTQTAPVSASAVLGQAGYMTNAGGTAANNFKYPLGIWTDGTKIAVVDEFSHRVMIWNSYPVGSDVRADMAVGTSSVDAAGGGDSPPTNSSLLYPQAVFYDGQRLIVSDTNNNRVLIWNHMPTSAGMAADVVLGQQDPTTSGTGCSETTMNSPRAVVAAQGSLFVSDSGNHRILAFTPIPTVTGTAARAVLGQASLTTCAAPSSLDATTINFVWSMVAIGDRLYVADFNARRVIRFKLN
jgi:hypothetical protein